MKLTLIITGLLMCFFFEEITARTIEKSSSSSGGQPTPILRNARSASEATHTHIVREERSTHNDNSKDLDALKTQIVGAERSTKADTTKIETPDNQKTIIVRERRAVDTSENILVNPPSDESRPERSPDFSPFGRADGEASSPRRRARSPAGFSPFGRAEGEASAPRRRARSPGYVPFRRAGH